MELKSLMRDLFIIFKINITDPEVHFSCIKSSQNNFSLITVILELVISFHFISIFKIECYITQISQLIDKKCMINLTNLKQILNQIFNKNFPIK